MWMSSRTLLSLCRERLARQVRVMMSPSLANKLGLTLWGPWRKGKGIEWECAVAMLQDNIHGRWEAMVMLGEVGCTTSWSPCMGEGRMTPANGIAVKEDLTQTERSNWDDTLVSVSDWREKNNTILQCSFWLHIIMLSFLDSKQDLDKEKKSKKPPPRSPVL